MVGVEVGDDDADDRPAKPGEHRSPASRGVGKAETGVDERPALQAREHVTVDVAETEREV